MSEVVVACYLDATEALVACSYLQSEGIAARLGDIHHTQANWSLSLALGGCRLFVPVAQADEARGLLERVAAPDPCPACGSRRVILAASRPTSWIFAVIGMVVANLPAFDPRLRYSCLECGHRWNPEDAAALQP